MRYIDKHIIIWYNLKLPHLHIHPVRGEIMRIKYKGHVYATDSNGVLLTSNFLSQRQLRYHTREGELIIVEYMRHPNGGGLVAADSYVPIDLHLPSHMIVGPETRLLDDKNLAGLSFIEGKQKNHVQISRVMTDEDRSERDFEKYRLLREWVAAQQRALRKAREKFLLWRLVYRTIDCQNQLARVVMWQARNDPTYRERFLVSGMM